MSKDTATRIDGASLSPDFDSHPGSTTTVKCAYWAGVTIECPVNQIDAGGLNFPKANEVLIDDPNRTGDKRRIPIIGCINQEVTADNIQSLRDILPRLVVRFTDTRGREGLQEEPGTGKNVGDVHVRARKGFVITIPTAEQIEQARKNGHRIPAYVRQPGDEPAARYMYLKFCGDQANPAPGSAIPETLEQAGIFWPGELEAAADLLS